MSNFSIDVDAVDKDIDTVNKPCHHTNAYALGLYYLAKREYSAHELHKKLSQKNISDDVIMATLARLQQEGYQSDNRFAESLCRRRLNSRHGDAKIRYELTEHRINNDVINDLLAKAYETIVANAYELIMHKTTKHKTAQAAWIEKQKISRFLQSRGYSYQSINEAFRQKNQ